MALMNISFYSHCLERTVNLRALIPIDAMDKPMSGKVAPLKTLYLLHGLYGSENDWLTYTRVAAYARLHDLAIICPAGENSFYTDLAAGHTKFLRFIGEEIPAFTRRLFPLSEKREDTYIGGLSMGGYGALNAAFTYPQTFSRVIALSAALDPWERMRVERAENVHQPHYAASLFGENRLEWDTLVRARRCSPERMPDVWLCCGAEDALCPKSEMFAKTAKENGWPVHFEITPGDHNWDFWDREIKRGIEWLYNEA